MRTLSTVLILGITGLAAAGASLIIEAQAEPPEPFHLQGEVGTVMLAGLPVSMLAADPLSTADCRGAGRGLRTDDRAQDDDVGDYARANGFQVIRWRGAHHHGPSAVHQAVVFDPNGSWTAVSLYCIRRGDGKIDDRMQRWP